MATCKGGVRGSKELDKTCNLQTYYCYYYVLLRYYAILCSARENNTVIKYIVYTNIRYWHISDNNGISDSNSVLETNSTLINQIRKLPKKDITITLEIKGGIENVKKSIKTLNED